MNSEDMNSEGMDGELPVPGNILLFEALMYASLGVDALSAAFTDYSETDLTAADKLTTAAFIGVFTFLVWFAARRQKRWARSVLLAALILSTVFVVALFRQTGLNGQLAIEALSLGLGASGMYYSFTGDARGWFGIRQGGDRRG